MAMIRAGIIFATGKFFIPQIRKPVANTNKPPTEEKSAIIVAVVNGMIEFAEKYSTACTNVCGIASIATGNPSVVAKISAVKKSRKDFTISNDGSPVIPSLMEPNIPVPLTQNRIRKKNEGKKVTGEAFVKEKKNKTKRRKRGKACSGK